MKRLTVILLLVAFVVTAPGCTFIKRHDSSSDSGRKKPSASLEVRKLIKALGSKDERESEKASNELIELGDEAIPSLISALCDDSSTREQNVSRTLHGMGSILLPYVPQMLSDKCSPGRLPYLSYIFEGIGDEVYPVLKELLNDEDSEMRLAVLRCLEGGFRKQKTQVQTLVPNIISAINDADSNVRIAAISALVVTDSDSQEVLNILIGLLGTEDDKLGSYLRHMFRERDPQTLLFLEEALVDENPTVRARAAFALFDMYIDKSVLVPVYIEALKHPADYVRSEAMWDFDDFGLGAKDALPLIMEIAQNDPKEGIRKNATGCIYLLGAPVNVAVPFLINQLSDSSGYVRDSAEYSIPRYGIKALPYVVDVLKHEDRNVRLSAIKILTTFGEEAKDSVDILIDALLDIDEYVRSAAIRAIMATHVDSTEVVLAIADCLSDEEYFVRELAVSALQQFGPAAKDAVPQLIQALDDESVYLRQAAVKTLGSIGPDAKEALPKIKEVDLGPRPRKFKDPCYNDPEEIRREAIERIEGTWEEE